MILTFAISIATVSAASLFHKRLLERIVKAPMAFFDTTPVGRILNRFSQDMATVDSSIRMTIIFFLKGISGLLTTVIAISYTTPIFLVAMIPLGIIYYFVWVSNVCLFSYKL